MLCPEATCSASYLLQIDALAFLRRLPVICLEDVAVHEWTPQIVWLMGALELGYKLRSHEAQMLVQVTLVCLCQRSL